MQTNLIKASTTDNSVAHKIIVSRASSTYSVALAIAEDLNLNVARVLNEFLDEESVIAKGIHRLLLAQAEALKKVLLIPATGIDRMSQT